MKLATSAGRAHHTETFIAWQVRRDLMELCTAQQQHAPRTPQPVWGGAAGADVTAAIATIQVCLAALCQAVLFGLQACVGCTCAEPYQSCHYLC